MRLPGHKKLLSISLLESPNLNMLSRCRSKFEEGKGSKFWMKVPKKGGAHFELVDSEWSTLEGINWITQSAHSIAGRAKAPHFVVSLSLSREVERAPEVDVAVELRVEWSLIQSRNFQSQQ